MIFYGFAKALKYIMSNFEAGNAVYDMFIRFDCVDQDERADGFVAVCHVNLRERTLVSKNETSLHTRICNSSHRESGALVQFGHPCELHNQNISCYMYTI